MRAPAGTPPDPMLTILPLATTTTAGAMSSPRATSTIRAARTTIGCLGTRGEDRKEQKRDEGRHGAERHRENVKENRAIGYWLLAGYNPQPTAH